MSPDFNRAQFFYKHLFRCDKCRNEWLELESTLPKSQRNIALSRVVEANHHNEQIIA